MLSGLDDPTFVNLTLGEAVCYKFPFPMCAATSTVWPQGDGRTLFNVRRFSK